MKKGIMGWGYRHSYGVGDPKELRYAWHTEGFSTSGMTIMKMEISSILGKKLRVNRYSRSHGTFE